MVAAAYDAIARVCDVLVVVVDHEAEAVVAALGDRVFQREVIGKAGQPMFISIRTGLQLARRVDAHANVVLQPADHPQVRLDTLESLVAASAEQPHRAVVPQYRGRGGHPVLIPPQVAELICAYDGRGGLRQFWIGRPHLCCRLSVDDPGVVLDIDTQSDYDFHVQ
jgi:molybdenum cofactor cytidylyltransferase